MADWIILDKTTGIGSDEVTITVSSYSELVERLKNLVFTTTDNKASDTCVVRQFGQSRYLLVEPSTVIASYTGGEVEVRVIASEAWTIGNLPSWASCNATGGGAGTKTVRFTVQPNTGDIRKWNVYFLATAAEDGEHVYEKALSGLNGWIDCFDKAKLKGYVFCGGVTMGGEISDNIKLKEAYDMGTGV